MKKTIKKLLLATLLCVIYVTPVQATDSSDIESVMNGYYEMQAETIQREERRNIEGYELPEIVDHNIKTFDTEGLSLLERLSICGKTSEFHLTLDNNTKSTIPHNYINMLKNNCTPFTLIIEEDGETKATIETNGITAQSGELPAHINIAQGVDYIQVSFDAVLNEPKGTFKVTFNCMDFSGQSYDVYEGNQVITTGKMESTGVMTLNLTNTNTKTIKFYTSKQIAESIKEETKEQEDEILQVESTTPTVVETTKTVESNNNMLLIIILIVAVIIIGAVMVYLITRKKRKQ